VPRAVTNTQSAPRANRLPCLWPLSRRASWATSGTSRTEAGVVVATRFAGAAVGARQLRAHVDHPCGEVDVVPDEAEQLGDVQAGVEDGRDHQPVARRADREQALDLGAAEHALAAPLRPGAFVVLEQLNGVGDDPTAAAREAHDALERGECARRGLRRAARAPQLVQQLGDVVDRERGDRPRPERR
jgi:hypothetical protein